MDAIKYLSLFSLVTNNLTYYGRRHFKLLTNCHVSWNILYILSVFEYFHLLCILMLKIHSATKLNKVIAKWVVKLRLTDLKPGPLIYRHYCEEV